MSLQGKVAVVTGSASGIGAAVARSLSAAGAAVVVNSSKSAAAGRAVAGSLPRAIYVQADVADDSACMSLAAAAQAEFGRIDVLVNNAGTTQLIPQHYRRVRRAVPPERLLVYRVQEGWEPLCRFLRTDIPDEPFPRVNAGGNLLHNIRTAMQSARAQTGEAVWR